MNKISAEQIQTWTRKISESDRQAFRRLFDSMYPRLVRFSHQYVRNKSAAADIVQDTFVMLWEKRQDADPQQSLKAYLYTTVKNRSLNYIRDHSNKTIELSSLNNLESDKKVTEPENEKIDERLQYLQKWIDHLPERQQEAFKLSRFEGLDHDEIAQVMDISPNTVNNHIVAALSTLRDRYESTETKTRRE